jgi:hypothetical protein
MCTQRNVNSNTHRYRRMTYKYNTQHCVGATDVVTRTCSDLQFMWVRRTVWCRGVQIPCDNIFTTATLSKWGSWIWHPEFWNGPYILGGGKNCTHGLRRHRLFLSTEGCKLDLPYMPEYKAVPNIQRLPLSTWGN